MRKLEPSDAIFSPSKTGAAMAVLAVPLPPALDKAMTKL